MPFEGIKTEKYKFVGFEQSGNHMFFFVVPVEGRDIASGDEGEIRDFLEELGKWESLIKAGLNLLSELKIVQVDDTTLQNYQKEFGSEKYRVDIQRDTMHERLRVSIYLTAEERHRREGVGLGSTLQVQEIYDQVKNVPKWRAFKNVLELARRNTM